MAMASNHSRNSASTAVDSKSFGSSVHNVLKILNSRLGTDGSIKDSKDVAYVMVLMAEAVKLVDRCMFLNVLRATKSQSVLKVMLESGGWSTLHTWLQQCHSEDAGAFLLELLLLYKHLPVTVELLRQNSCAKDIKQLAKTSNNKIAGLAKDIVVSWMDKVKEKSSSEGSIRHSEKKSNGQKHSSHSSSSSSNHKSTSSSAKNSRHASSPHSSTSSTQSSVSYRDKSAVKYDTTTDNDYIDPSRVKTLQDSPDHITAKLNHRSLSADHIHTSNASTVDDGSSNKMSVDTDNSVVQPPVHRPKTVKMIGSKMRSTGLELDTPLLPTKKNVSTPSDKDKVVQSTHTVKSQSSKKMALDKKSPSSASGSSFVSSPPPVDVKPKIKVVPTKIYECSGFMDAFSATDTLNNRRKRKLSTAPSSKLNAGLVSPDEKKSTPPSFNHDSMEVENGTPKNESAQSSVVASDVAADDKIVTSDERATEVTPSTDVSDVAEDSVADAEPSEKVEQSNEESCSKDSSMVEPASKKKKVKAVSWVEESNLCSFFYFQLDENERVNVNKVKDFAENRKHEQEMERHMMQNVRRMAHDIMSEKRVWRKPFLITGLTQTIVYGCNSKEKETQRERELGVLQVLYFSKNSIPDSAVEPEPEYFELIEPKIIPLCDETGLGSEVVYDSYPTSAPVPPASGNNQPSVASLPPAIADLLSATVNQVQNGSGGGGELPPGLVPQMSPNSSQPSPNPPPNVSLPPLHVFLGMPLPQQQQIFKAMPAHIQQQMINSLPPLLQQQLAHLMPPMSNGAPGPRGPIMRPPDFRPNMGAKFPRGPMGPMGPPGPGRMPMPLLDINPRRAMRPEPVGFPQFPPANMMVRGAAPPQNRVCAFFMNGFCRFGNACRQIHPLPDALPVDGVAIVGQDSPH